MPDILTTQQLENSLDNILNSPQDQGTLEMIVIRPAKNTRQVINSCQLTVGNGAEGDRWTEGSWKSLANGSPHPNVQIAIMNSRALSAIAGPKERWPLAGDNLIIDMDLGTRNLPPGQRLGIGEAELEVTNVLHNGCAKFMNRYGKDAVLFVNSKQGKTTHLRGVYARIVKDSQVNLGDTIRKL